MYHLRGYNMTSLRLNYSCFYNMHTRYLHIEKTTFTNLITNFVKPSHYGCQIEASDLVGSLRETKNSSAGNYFMNYQGFPPKRIKY